MTIPERLIGTLHSDLTAAVRDALAATDAEEWRTLAQLAQSNKVAPYWIGRLQQHGVFSQLPNDLQTQLQKLATENKWRNLHIYKLLNELLSALDGRDVLLLKGAHLANYVYAERGMRRMVDVDILVRRTEAHAAAAALGTLGYKIAPDLQAWYWENHYHWLLQPPPKQELRVELHWDVKRPRHSVPFPIECVWEHSTTVQLSHQTARVMSADMLLVYLVWHAMHEQWQSGLKTLLDCAELLQTQTLDYATVQRLAQRLDVTKQVALVLHLVKTWFGVAIDDGLITAVHPAPFPKTLANAAMSQFVGVGDVSAEFANLWQDGRPDVGVLWRSFLLPKAEMGELYAVDPNSASIYLYYPRHALTLVRRHWRNAWRILRGDATLNAEVNLVDEYLETATWINLTEADQLPAHDPVRFK